MVNRFGWSLHEIDETSIESLLPFVLRLNRAGGDTAPKKIYCDQVDFL